MFSGCSQMGFAGRVPPGITPWRSGKEVTSPPPPPGSRGALLLPSPLRTTRKPSVYAAQASLKVPRGTRWGAAHHLHDTGLELTSGTPRRPHQQASCCHLLCLPSQLPRRSRAETPEGSQPAFAWGDLARRLNPYPSDYGAAFASSLLLYPPSHQQPPCGGPTPRGGRRAYHVPRMYHGWLRLCLSADGSTATAGEWGAPAPGHLPFWFQPVSAFGLLDITAFISSSPELALPSTLAPDRLGASPCLGPVDVTPWRTRLDFPDCHYITVSSPSGGVGGFRSVSFNAFRTRARPGSLR